MKYMIISIALIFLSISSCARWKVQDLQPTETIMIPFGNENHQIKVTRNDNGIFNTPTEVTMDDDYFYIADIKGAKILILARDSGQITEVIGDKNQLANLEIKDDKKKSKGKKKKYNPSAMDVLLKDKIKESQKKSATTSTRTLSKKSKNMLIHHAPLVYPGKIHIAENNFLYVQNRVPIESKYEKNKDLNDKAEYIPESAPSKVLVFNEKRKIIKELLRDSMKNIPFKQILGIYSKEKEEVIIISRDSSKKWFIQSFALPTFKLKYNYTITPSFIQKHDNISDKEKYLIFIENIIPKFNKNEFLISAAYYRDTRFKFRRIISFNVKNADRLMLYTELQEPQNELYSSLENNSIYLWSSESYNEIKLKIYDQNGDLVSNKKIQLFGKDEAWRNFIALPNGNIITLYVSRIGIEIILWS